MAYPVPTSLSPSRVEAFTSCPLAFRFASIDRLPEPPQPATAKGSLVHRALELLFCREPHDRTPEAAATDVARAVEELRDDPEFVLLGLDEPAQRAFFGDASRLVERYFAMEDPRAVRAIGLELRLEAVVGDLTLRGIIDRLELDADGELVVTDYKTGRAPAVNREQQRLGGVHFYAFLCEQALGRRPARIQLLYLSSGEVIETRPSEQSTRFLPRRTEAVYQAVVRACGSEDFRPRTGPLCAFCAFKPWCPAFGGDPDRAAAEAPLALATAPPAGRRPRVNPPRRSFDPAHPFGTAVARFDTRVDAAFDHLRSNQTVDRLFHGTSAAGDWSRLWLGIGITQAVLDRRRAPDLVRLSAALGVESLLVNQGIKRLFLRPRPTFVAGVGPIELRTPLTSSFPSGHASAGFCAAVLLTQRQPRLAPVWFGLAVVVACSRIHVRMHHASDVVVGAAIGASLGVLSAKLVPLDRSG